MKALFAYNVHRYVLSGQRQFSFALNKIFWLFFTAVLAIQLAFLVPDALLEGILSVERINGWRPSVESTAVPPDLWVLLPALSQIAGEFLVFIPIALFLAILPSIVAYGKMELSANLKIGKAFYWQIFWGLLILHLILSLYAFLIGLVQVPLLLMFLEFDDTRFALYSMAFQTILLVPIGFFYALLGATFTSAVLIRGSKYLGLANVEKA